MREYQQPDVPTKSINIYLRFVHYINYTNNSYLNPITLDYNNYK
jgi:hypothetical protein